MIRARMQFLILLGLLCIGAGPAAAFQLAPYKDQLFAYPGIYIDDHDGGYRMVDYDEMRDINARDEIPERRVSGQYVSLGVTRHQRDIVTRTANGSVAHYAVGKADQASLIVIYLHGRGGNRHQGVNDYSFGGNFNRIKNLVAAAGGLYLVPDFPDFEQAGARHLAGLIQHYAARSPRARVFVACGSMGGALCWRLGRDEQVASRLGGLILLGSMWDNAFLKSAAFGRRVPVFIGQGSNDRVFPVAEIEAFYNRIRAADAGYPVRLVRFETGGHGTPIRMTDWRETLNWMLAAGR